eukprot:5069551-Amphidinium_carterae.1
MLEIVVHPLSAGDGTLGLPSGGESNPLHCSRITYSKKNAGNQTSGVDTMSVVNAGSLAVHQSDELATAMQGGYSGMESVIVTWNDGRIKQDNPNKKIPNKKTTSHPISSPALLKVSVERFGEFYWACCLPSNREWLVLHAMFS